MDRVVTLTWYRHALDARNGRRIQHDGDELAASISNPLPRRGEKADEPLLCLATFRDNHRGNERVESVHMLGLDLDEPQAEPAAHVAKLASALGGVEVFAYSTASSAPSAFKLRAIVPYSQPATGDEHRASWALVARVLSRAGINVDRACCDPGRGFYVWSLPPNGAYFSAHLPGEPWPVGRAAEVEAIRREAEERAAEARRAALRPVASSASIVDRARRYVATMPAAISGSGGHAATFAVARRLVADFALSDSDALALLHEFNARCKPAWTEKELRHKLESAKAARVRVPMVGT